MSNELLIYVLGIAVPAIGWFLKNKDEQQAQQIKLLFEKHDDDAKALQDLRVKIAEKHYEKPETDAKVERLEAAIKTGINDLGQRFDRLTDALLAHINKEERQWAAEITRRHGD